MPGHLSLFVKAIVGLSLGATAIVLAISWFRSCAVAKVEQMSGAKRLSEWPYTVGLWIMAALLGLGFYLVGPMPLWFSVALAGACTIGVLGFIWPVWMHDSRLSPAQRFAQRLVYLVISGILIVIAAGHSG